MKYFLGLITYIFIVKIVSALKLQDLGGKWILENAGKEYSVPAEVPGGVYTDLMRNKIIGDVFNGSNDIETRWVSKLNWNYSRKFVVNESLIKHDVINLVLDGVDTFSIILINNVEIGKTDNMFVQYIFDIKPYLVVGDNDIQIQFKSAVAVALSEFIEQSKDYVVLPECVPSSYNGECHVNHIRKMQASFAWDWGPALPSVGIWKPIYIESFDSAVIKYVTVDILSNNAQNCWHVIVHTYFTNGLKNSVISGTLNIKLYTDEGAIISLNTISVTKDKNSDFVSVNNITVYKTYVREWWPNGYGTAHLYQLQVTYMNRQKAEQHTKSLKIGFRTVELVQNIISSGRQFYFRVNNIPIFAKGSNIIPINILPELGQDERKIRFLFQSAKDAHMNMMRVWGGGVYESDILYQVADEMGILIWQDFMFACSMYPVKEDFLRNVQNEVRHQVRRLQHHASIALWAGNNENEVALRQNWYNTSTNYTIYKRDYIELYVNVIKTEVQKYDSTRTFLISSPTNGIQSEKENYLADNPQSYFYGDVHFYNYLVDGWKTSTYPTTRFTSEYGYQSLPHISTLMTATNNPGDLSITSDFLTKREHQPFGYYFLELLIEYQFNLPEKNSTQFFKKFVYYSQIYQAMGVKIQTEHYRRCRSNLNDNGEGLTMGALYWQLNDVWVAPTWSSIDYKNNWKMLHYFAKNFFAPIIITGNMTVDKKINVYVVSDLIEVVRNASISISIFKWDSFTPIKEETLHTHVLPGMSQKINMNILSVFTTHQMDNQCGKFINQCFVHLTLLGSNNQIAPENFLFPVPLNTTTLQIPHIKVVNIEQIGHTQTFTITIVTTKISLFVWMDAGNVQGRFSDNGFLQVTPRKIVQFYSQQPTTVVTLTKSLKVTNLMDSSYQ